MFINTSLLLTIDSLVSGPSHVFLCYAWIVVEKHGKAWVRGYWQSHAYHKHNALLVLCWIYYLLQVMQGLRKCSSLDIEYMGDPVLQPIRSFENATLVRALHHLSCGLNDRVQSCQVLMRFTMSLAVVCICDITVCCSVDEHWNK